MPAIGILVIEKPVSKQNLYVSIKKALEAADAGPVVVLAAPPSSNLFSMAVNAIISSGQPLDILILPAEAEPLTLKVAREVSAIHQTWTVLVGITEQMASSLQVDGVLDESLPSPQLAALIARRRASNPPRHSAPQLQLQSKSSGSSISSIPQARDSSSQVPHPKQTTIYEEIQPADVPYHERTPTKSTNHVDPTSPPPPLPPTSLSLSLTVQDLLKNIDELRGELGLSPFESSTVTAPPSSPLPPPPPPPPPVRRSFDEVQASIASPTPTTPSRKSNGHETFKSSQGDHAESPELTLARHNSRSSSPLIRRSFVIDSSTNSSSAGGENPLQASKTRFRSYRAGGKEPVMDPLEDPLGAAMQMAYGSSPGSLHSPLEEGKDEGHATNRQDAEAIVQGVEGKGSAANDSNESLLALFSAKEGGNAKQENEKLEREEEEEGEDLMKALDDPHDYDRSDPGRAHPPVISHLDADDVSSDQAPDTTSPPADKEVVEPYLQLSPTLVHAVPDPDDPAVADEADAAANSDDALSFISGLVVDVEAEALIPMHGDIAPRVDHGDDNAAEEKKEGANEPLDVAPIPLYEALLEMESKVQSALEGLRQRTEVRLAAVHQAKLDQVKAEEIIVAKASEGNEEDMLVKDKDKVEAVLADDMAAEADEEEEAQLAKEPVAVEADVQTVQGQEPLVPETENAKEEEPMVEMLAVQEERPDAGDQAEEPPVESTVTEEGITLAKVLAPSDDNVDDCDMDVSTTPIEEPTPVSWVHSDNGWVRSSDGAEQLLEVSLADEAIHDLREDEKEALDVAFVARSGSLPGFAAMDPVELISPAVTEEVRPDEEVVVLTDEMAAEEPATEEASVIEAACEVPAIEDAPAIEDTGEEAVMEVLATQIDAEGSAIEEGLVGENTAKEQGIQEASAIEATAEEQAVEEEALATEIEAEEQAIEVAPVIEASAEVPAIGEALATLIVAQDPAIEETTAAEADGNVSEVSEKATPPAEVGSALLLEEASIDYVDESEQEALNVAALARTPHANEGEGEGDSFHDLIDLDEDEFLKAVQVVRDASARARAASVNQGHASSSAGAPSSPSSLLDAMFFHTPRQTLSPTASPIRAIVPLALEITPPRTQD